MYVPFDTMPENARLWVYQADRELNDIEIESMNYMLKEFAENWNSHGTALKASYMIVYQRFLILAVDEQHTSASGCSIDKSVAILRQIGEKYQIDFFDRTNIILFKEPKFSTLKIKDLKEKIKQGELTPETIIFNNVIQQKSQLTNEWQIPAKKTWLSRYFS